MNEQNQEFRDKLAISGKKGKRQWIYPKIIKGSLYKYRVYLAWFLLALLFIGPWLKIGGRPLLMFNVIERQFVIFGKTFWPQDFFIFAIAIITTIIVIIVFTVLFGRVWCGWACPQTIFMEMVFRKIENFFEGNSKAQKKLSEQKWDFEKLRKRGLKHVVFFIISALISATFLAYIIGSDALIESFKNISNTPISQLISFFIFTLLFYMVFAYLREIVCIMICPYGRLQGVMLDKNSIVVAYDDVRGEPRGKRKRNETQEEKGDCIDCGLCVDVCPTGIDIRNGTQLECVNCTACIDACDSVMEKINKPKRLITFASENGIKNKTGFAWTARAKAYVVLMVVLMGILSIILISRKDIDANLLRTTGQKAYHESNGVISNIFNLELINKTLDDIEYTLVVENNDKVKLELIDKSGIAPGNEEIKEVVLLHMNSADVENNETPIELSLYCEGVKIKSLKTKFIAPIRH